LSRNFLIRSLSTAYVEAFRNVPVLLQLFIWYFILTEFLPPIDEALQPIPDVFFSKNGLQYPIPVWAVGHLWMVAGIVVGIVAAWVLVEDGAAPVRGHGTRPTGLPAWIGDHSGVRRHRLARGWSAERSRRPRKDGHHGGRRRRRHPEFLTVLIGLTLYTASYIAEIVRGGIQAVAYGQHEAASALGLSGMQETRLILLPQALRVIIPPITSQYLNLTKNSSLAVAVGYPDLVSISTTTLNQTGRAHRGDLARDARLSHDVAADRADHESLQPPLAHQGTVRRDERRRSRLEPHTAAGASVRHGGVIPWLKRNLFSDWKNTLGTLIVLALLVRYLPPLLQWAVFNAVARPTTRRAGRSGTKARAGAWLPRSTG
jgi:ABC-type amino acid transport system permease subunit